MKITEKDVRYVSALANLELSDSEVNHIAEHMDAILAYVEKLNEVDTNSVEPMAQVLYDAPADLTLREDRERPCLSQDKALSNAPQSGAGHFKVARVIER